MFGLGKSKKSKESEMKFVGRFVPKKGLTIYEVNQETLEYAPATFIEQEGTTRKRINMKPGCSYVQALNVKNLERKLGKLKQ